MFEAYKDDINNGYVGQEATYGESVVRTSLQFDELMNWVLASEETVNGKIKSDKYTRVEFTIKGAKEETTEAAK